MLYIYKLRDDLYKVIDLYSNAPKNACVDVETGHDSDASKTADNIRRAYRSIQELALCNDWDWFGTFTLDPNKYNRLDLPKFRRDLTRFLRKIKDTTGTKVEYLLVPELHRNKKGWHMHGLLSGLSPDMLREFTLKEKIPVYLREKLKNNDIVYDWPAYRNRFGFIDLEPIKNRDAAARYLAKYITKDKTTPEVLKAHEHLYFCSQGLKRPDLVFTGMFSYRDMTKAASSPLAALPLSRITFSHEWEYGCCYWVTAKPSIDHMDHLGQEN